MEFKSIQKITNQNQRELGKSNSKKRRNKFQECSNNWNSRNEIHAGRLVILLSIPQTGWQPLQVFFHTFHDIDIRLLAVHLDSNIQFHSMGYMGRTLTALSSLHEKKFDKFF